MPPPLKKRTSGLPTGSPSPVNAYCDREPLDGLTWSRIAPPKKCLRTATPGKIILPLPAAASHSERRSPFSSRLSRDTVAIFEEICRIKALTRDRDAKRPHVGEIGQSHPPRRA